MNKGLKRALIGASTLAAMALPGLASAQEISSVADGLIRVQPFADFYRLEYVRIITEFPGEVAGQIVPSSARPSRQR